MKRNKCCGGSWLNWFGIVTNKMLYKMLREIMSTQAELETLITDIKNIVGNVGSDVDSLLAQVAALKAQIDAGTPVSQEQLDAAVTGLQSIKDSLAGVDAKEPGAPRMIA